MAQYKNELGEVSSQNELGEVSSQHSQNKKRQRTIPPMAPFSKQQVEPGFARPLTIGWTNSFPDFQGSQGSQDSQGSQLSTISSCYSDFTPVPDIGTFSSILGSGKQIIRETITTIFNNITMMGDNMIFETITRRKKQNQQEIENKKAEIEARIQKHNNKLLSLRKTLENERTTRIQRVAELEEALHLLIIEEPDILTNKELLRIGLPELFTNKDFKWWSDETIDKNATETWLMNYIRQTDILLAIQQTGIIDTIRCSKNILPDSTANITLGDLIQQTIIEGALIYSDGLSLTPDAASHKITPDGLIQLLNYINTSTEIDYQSIWGNNAALNADVDQLFALIPVTEVDAYPNLTAAMGTPVTAANARGAPTAQAQGMPEFANAEFYDDVDEVAIPESSEYSLHSEPSYQASGPWTVREAAWQMKYEGKQLIVPDGKSLEEVERILKAAKQNIEHIRNNRQNIVSTPEYHELIASLYELSDKYVNMITELNLEINNVQTNFNNGGKDIHNPRDQIEWTTIINGILSEYSTEYDEIFKARLGLIEKIKTILSQSNGSKPPPSGGNKSRKHKKHLNKYTRKHKKRYTRKLHKKHKRGHTKKH